MTTRIDIRNQIRRIADIETDGNHITDDEINEDLNSSLSALWAILVDASNGSLFSTVAPQIVFLGDNSYQLPPDFLRLVSVDVKRGSTYIHSVEADVQRYTHLLAYANRNYGSSQHYLQWNKQQQWYELFVFPPVPVDELVVRYIPDAPQLEVDTDELNTPADWSRWAVYDVAIKCNIKEETDPSAIMMEREKIERRIINDIKSQSVAQVKTIRDVIDWEEGDRFNPPSIYSGQS